jgi:ATP-dependent helicase/DNAse subunit B
VWSATQLERIGRCGFAFLAGTAMSLRASGDVDPDDADARDVGSARHVALSRIYPRLDVLLGAGEPTDAERAEIAAVVHEEVERAIEEQGGGWTRLEGLRKARVQELANEITEYIAWEMKPVRGIAPRRPVATELSFGLEDAGLPAAILDAGDGRTVRLRGQIDRVDAVLVDGADDGWRYVVDHKSSGGALTDLKQLQPAGAVLQLALYLHVLNQVQPGAKPWGGTYQLVRTRERKAPLERCSAVKKGINVVANDTQKRANEVIEGAATLAANLVDTALAGRLPARTPGTSDCLAYCDFRDVCREERMQPKSW